MGLREDSAEIAPSAKAPRRAGLRVCENKVEMEGGAKSRSHEVYQAREESVQREGAL